MFLKSGKLNIIIDGQFGSTGKGVMSAWVGNFYHVDIAITNSSTNAGHSFFWRGKKQVARHLPISGILNERSQLYLCAGSIIDPDVLEKEMELFDVDPCRLAIHPRAAVISAEDIVAESKGQMIKIASTCKGVGSALSRKVLRIATLAKDSPRLKEFVSKLDLNWYLQQGVSMIMEVPQGFDLSINSGYDYPCCTSREITVAAALSDAQVHPSFLGNVMLCLRTFPIRVGNVVKDGIEVGVSGPFYPDSQEISWKDLNVPEEYTTNTNRIRRVATFSMTQFKKAMEANRPTHVFLNFANYLSEENLSKMIDELECVTHVGFGPDITDIEEIR